MSNTTTLKRTEPEVTIPELSPELLRGPAWLTARREESRETFNTTPLPRRGLHLWRYVDPATFLIDQTAVTDTAFGDDYDAVEKIEMQHLRDGSLAGLVVDLGGREITCHLDSKTQADGVIVARLSEAMALHPELVREHFYSLVGKQTGKFEALNAALWNDGIFVYVPDGRTVEKPLHLLREAGHGRSAQYPRLLVVIGRNAEATIIDEYAGGSTDIGDGISYSNGAVEIVGLEDSRTRYVMLQRQGHGANSYLTHRARIEAGARMLTIPLSFGGNLSKQNFGVILNGETSESHMYGVLFGSGFQQFDNHTLHRHAASRTHSNIDFKVVLRDRAQSAYTGLIRIEHESRTCEAYQENRNLLLNKGAKAETIPELEILNEDVQCSHGATLGPIDPEAIFYLGSRGIDHEQAVRMIVRGFIEPTLQHIPTDLHDRISDVLTDRLEKA